MVSFQRDWVHEVKKIFLSEAQGNHQKNIRWK